MIANVVLVGLIAAVIVAIGVLIRECLGLQADRATVLRTRVWYPFLKEVWRRSDSAPEVPCEPTESVRVNRNLIEVPLEELPLTSAVGVPTMFAWNGDSPEFFPHPSRALLPGYIALVHRRALENPDPYVWIDPFEGASNYG